MTDPLLSNLTMPLGLDSRFWSLYVALILFQARDLLFLLWVNLAWPNFWSDSLGCFILLLILLFGALVIQFDYRFLLPVFAPGFVLEPNDLIWPVAMIVGLLVLIARSWRDIPQIK